VPAISAAGFFCPQVPSGAPAVPSQADRITVQWCMESCGLLARKDHYEIHNQCDNRACDCKADHEFHEFVHGIR
jgi:hypothetical protein